MPMPPASSRCPRPARFEQGWMQAAGRRRAATTGVAACCASRSARWVELQPDTRTQTTRGRGSRAASAEIDRVAGVMRFAGSAPPSTPAGRWMQGRPGRPALRSGSIPDRSHRAGRRRSRARGGKPRVSDVQGDVRADDCRDLSRRRARSRATLAGDARLQGANTDPGRLRELSAPTGRRCLPRRCARAGADDDRGAGQVELFGDRPGAAGLTIDAGFVEMTLRAESADIDTHSARGKA